MRKKQRPSLLDAKLQKQTKITIVAPVSDVRARTRLGKVVDVLTQEGIPTELWGWARNQEEAKAEASSPRKLLVTGGGYASRSLIFRYLEYMARVTKEAYASEGVVAHALGLEGALPMYVASRVGAPIHYIYDDADRRSKCHAWPAPLKTVLEFVEREVASRALVHIIPGKARYEDGTPCAQTVVIKNTPSQAVLQKSLTLEPTFEPKAKLNVFLSGWIGETRGSPTFLEAAKALQQEADIHFVVAGRLTGDSAEALVKLPNVTYLGSLSNEQALAQQRCMDLVLTYYDPSIEINRFAEPNKWGDCLALATPFVVNAEVQTGAQLRKEQLCFTLPYADASGLEELLRSLLHSPEKLQEHKARLAQAAAANKAFDHSYREQVVPSIRRAHAPYSEGPCPLYSEGP